MAEDDLVYCQQQLIGSLDPSSSMVVIRESSIFAKDDRVVFPPINHENLQVASSIYSYLESPSESSSPSSSSRRSDSFSSFPSDSDGQFDRKSPSGNQGKSPPSPDSDGQSLLTACQFDRESPRSPSEQCGKAPPSDSDVKSPLYHEADVFQDWWELLLVRVYAKLKNLVTWFSLTLRSLYPVLAFAIWWWMRVRARRRRVKGDAIKERDEKILELLQQIAQMNELLVKHHKDMVSRR